MFPSLGKSTKSGVLNGLKVGGAATGVEDSQKSPFLWQCIVHCDCITSVPRVRNDIGKSARW
jgi:hypothetical protein